MRAPDGVSAALGVITSTTQKWSRETARYYMCCCCAAAAVVVVGGSVNANVVRVVVIIIEPTRAPKTAMGNAEAKLNANYCQKKNA